MADHKLTQAQLGLLRRAVTWSGMVSPGPRRGSAAHALVAKGYLERIEAASYRITDAGRSAYADLERTGSFQPREGEK